MEMLLPVKESSWLKREKELASVRGCSKPGKEVKQAAIKRAVGLGQVAHGYSFWTKGLVDEVMLLRGLLFSKASWPVFELYPEQCVLSSSLQLSLSLQCCIFQF